MKRSYAIVIIYAAVFLFFCAMNVHALGKSEAQYRRELGQYPIQVSLYLPTTISLDYVFIDTDRFILVENIQLTEINLSIGEQKKIEIPEDWAENKRSLRFRFPQYDKVNNSVHFILVNNVPEYRGQTYHILHLDDYSWETIEELGNKIEYFYYDVENMYIFFYHYITYENESGYIRVSYISTYDLQKREIVDRVELPDDTHTVVCLYQYDNQTKMLAKTRSTQIEWGLHFFIYDILNRTRIDFPESLNNDFSFLSNLIPVNGNGCFLSVLSRTGDKSSIAVMNLNNNTVETIALDNFPYTIYNLKQIAEGRYSFIVSTRTSGGFHGPQFLCFFDYP